MHNRYYNYKLRKMTLKYHQPIFDLLNVKPIVDIHRMEDIKTIEDNYNITLPEAIKEYFLVSNMLDTLFEFGVFLEVNPLYMFGKSTYFEGLNDSDLALMQQRKVIPLFSERNQQWTWFLNLKYESDDPKVLLHTKDFPDMLISHPHKFTKQLYLSVWDALVMQPQLSGFYMTAQHTMISDTTLSELRRVMREISTTYIMVANETTYRFEWQDTFIAVLDNGEKSDWYFYAKSIDGLERSLQLAQKIKGLIQKMQAKTWGTSENNTKKMVIQRILNNYQ